jgi:AcrR family transcriptional regulator
MLRWTLLFQTPAARRLAERLSERARQALAQGRKAPARDMRAPLSPGADARERLLEHALLMSVAVGYRELSAPQIADSADVSIDAFFEQFEGKQECFLAALDMLGERLLALASDRRERSDGWPQAVRARIGELLGYLADHPIYAQTIAEGAFAAGPEAIEANVALANAIAAALTDGAPAVADAALAVQGVAGALSHTVRCQVASGQIQLLSVLSDYLSYIVLAPFVGSEHAAQVVIEDA